jgi:hypothetical protein
VGRVSGGRQAADGEGKARREDGEDEQEADELHDLRCKYRLKIDCGPR